MNIENFEENSGGFSKKLYTGLGRFQVLTVNPDGEELTALYGMKEPAKEPNYDRETGGTRIDIYVREVNVSAIMKIAFFTSNEDVVSEKKDSEGNIVSRKQQYVNAAGQNFYYASIDAIKEANDAITDPKEAWRKFSLEGVRVAKEGEVQIIEFVKALFNLNNNPKNNLEFQDWKKISNGNVKELRGLMSNAGERGRTIVMLCGVRDEKYQDLYGNKFLPNDYKPTWEAALFKKVEDVKYPWKSHFTKGSLKEFVSVGAPTELELDSTNPFKDIRPEDLSAFTPGKY